MGMTKTGDNNIGSALYKLEDCFEGTLRAYTYWFLSEITFQDCSGKKIEFHYITAIHFPILMCPIVGLVGLWSLVFGTAMRMLDILLRMLSLCWQSRCCDVCYPSYYCCKSYATNKHSPIILVNGHLDEVTFISNHTSVAQNFSSILFVAHHCSFALQFCFQAYL